MADQAIRDIEARARNEQAVRDAISTSIQQDRTVAVEIRGGEDAMYDAILSATTDDWDHVDADGATDVWSLDTPEGEAWRLRITYE